jgi:Zn ribbon nucleic-acid-binding protein
MNNHDDYCECPKCLALDRCEHPNADKVDGRWWCGFCGRELDENMKTKLLTPAHD